MVFSNRSSTPPLSQVIQSVQLPLSCVAQLVHSKGAVIVYKASEAQNAECVCSQSAGHYIHIQHFVTDPVLSNRSDSPL